MSRDRGDRADDRGGKAVAQDVADILPQAEAERYEDGIDDAVILTVELRTAPGAAGEEQILAALLGDRDNDKIEQDVVGDGALRDDPAQDQAQDTLLHQGQQ